MSPLRPLILLLFLSLLWPDTALSQLLPSRTWTNRDGKKMRAELLRFGKDREAHLIYLRIRGGNIYKIQPETLARKDQALILKSRFDKDFHHHHNEEEDHHSFRPYLTGGRPSISATIYSEVDNNRLALRLTLDGERLSEGAAIVLTGSDSGYIRTPYDADAVSYRKDKESLTVYLDEEADSFYRIIAGGGRPSLLVESTSKSLHPINIPPNDLTALQKVARAYRSLDQLSTDHTWWSVFQNMSAEEVTALVKQRAGLTVAESKPAMKEPAEASSIAPARDWQVLATGETINAEVAAFFGDQVELRLAGGDKRKIQIAALSPTCRNQLASIRMDHSIAQAWHPHDDVYTWYWPIDVTDPGARLAHTGLLFTIQRETGQPTLFLQTHYENAEGTGIENTKLKSSDVSLDMDFPADAPTYRLRTPDRTIEWYALPDDYVELLMVATPVLHNLELSLVAADGESSTEPMDAEAFQTSMEVVEIYRIWHSLLTMEEPPAQAEETPTPPADKTEAATAE